MLTALDPTGRPIQCEHIRQSRTVRQTKLRAAYCHDAHRRPDVLPAKLTFRIEYGERRRWSEEVNHA